MNVEVYNYGRSKKLASFPGGVCSDLTFAKEIPGGCITADFNVAADFDQDHAWAKRHNQVEIYSNAKRVWRGLIYSIGRGWGAGESFIKVGCVGLIFKLSKLVTSNDLNAEKGSTWMTDHLVTHDTLRQWVKGWDIETTDYLIPDTIDVDRYGYLSDMVEAINKFNGWGWGVDQDFTFFFRPYRVTQAVYITDLQNSSGMLNEDMEAYADTIYYLYEDLFGAPQSGSCEDYGGELPNPHDKIITLPGQNSAAQALVYAAVALDEALVAGSSTEVIATKVWDRANTSIHPSEIEPGQAIFVRGILPGRKDPGTFFEPDDISTFVIKTMTYTDVDKSVSLGPGKVADKLEVLLARIE